VRCLELNTKDQCEPATLLLLVPAGQVSVLVGVSAVAGEVRAGSIRTYIDCVTFACAVFGQTA
jgi:hypothetical protein